MNIEDHRLIVTVALRINMRFSLGESLFFVGYLLVFENGLHFVTDLTEDSVTHLHNCSLLTDGNLKKMRINY